MDGTQLLGIVAVSRALGSKRLRFSTRSGTMGPMQYLELGHTSHRLRRIAEARHDHDALDLLNSLDETLDGLTGPQRRSPRILADMAKWLLRIESGMAQAPKTEELATAKK